MKTIREIRPLEILRTAKWITLAEALVYMCIRSRNTLLGLVKSGKIYGTRQGGEYVIDRESCDRYYNTARDEMRLRLAERFRRAG